MRVFVTGASGWIGSAVVPELLDAGHEVRGLARSDASAAAVEAAGAAVVRGDVDDLDVLRAAAADADAVVHLAFRHDIAFSGGFAEAVGSDLAAIEAMGAALPDGGALAIAGGHPRARRRPARHRARRPRPGHPGGGPPGERRRSPSASRRGSGRRSCASRRPCTARATAASSPP